MNLILGGGDVGKTTLLEAIELLLHPFRYVPADTDYFQRDVESGFEIEGVFQLPEHLLSQDAIMKWPWVWDGNAPVVPDGEGDVPSGPQTAAYILRVRGTSDLDTQYEIVQPNGETSPLPASLRRSIGLLRLIGQEDRDRDLRLVYGSGLDRLVGDPGLRPRLAREMAASDVSETLSSTGQGSLRVLNDRFVGRGLPSELGLGMVGTPGVSIGSLIGLTADMSGVRLPLTVWGTGTRRLASLTVAELLQDGHPITLVDEMERGLEPYRQRSLAKSLMKAGGQSLVTTHSSAAIGALTNASLWYMDSQQRLGELSGTAIAAHGSRDPEAFLARLLIVCEGATEVGFATHMLEKVLRADLLDHGVRLTDAGGNDTALELLTVLGKARLRIAGIVDNEMRSPGRWQRVGQRLGDLLLQWPSGCLEEQVIPLFPVERWQELVQDPNGDLTGIRLRHLGDRLQISDSDVSSVADAAKGRVLYLIVDAATGRLPPDLPQGRRAEFKSHARSWFKSVEGGRELAHKVFELGAWESLEPLVRSFIAALARNLNIRLA